jgi:hypothetical protein
LALGFGVGLWRWALALGFGVGLWRWALALGFGGPERARCDSPGQRPGLDAPMIPRPEGAEPLARENGHDVGSGPPFSILGSKRRAESAVGDAPARRLDLHGKGPGPLYFPDFSY